jgi:hypothetical protein
MMAVVAMGAPLVGVVEMSLPPCVVPTDAETAFVNVGVRLTVAPNSGEVVEAVIDAVDASTTFTMVVADLVASSFDVAVIVTLPAVPGAVHTPVLTLIAPPLAVQLIPLVFPPLAVVLKVVALLTVRVGAAGLIAFTTTVCGVTKADVAVAV